MTTGDRYRCFHELGKHHVEGRDYEVRLRQGTTGVAVVAIHGGRIEAGTYAIAAGVAGDEDGLYGFRGIKPEGNANLHLTSTRFDEPRALGLVQSSLLVFSIHGCVGESPRVFVGGRDRLLRETVANELERAGFVARESRSPGLGGTDRNNICNRGRTGRGVQLELSEGLRKELLTDPVDGRPHRPAARFSPFCGAVRRALAARAATISRRKGA
jgi:phage replication-related protein YjqB (UPF0714/DUF867 family)